MQPSIKRSQIVVLAFTPPELHNAKGTGSQSWVLYSPAITNENCGGKQSMRAAIPSLLTLTIVLTIGCEKGSETARAPVNASATPTITPTNNPTPSEGFTNFQKHCASCHGDGDAEVVKVNDKTLRVPSLRKGHALNHTDEKLAQQIADGDDEMPAFKDKLSTAEINELVKYIRTEFQGK
jgi:cytochrome c6